MQRWRLFDFVTVALLILAAVHIYQLKHAEAMPEWKHCLTVADTKLGEHKHRWEVACAQLYLLDQVEAKGMANRSDFQIQIDPPPEGAQL